MRYQIITTDDEGEVISNHSGLNVFDAVTMLGIPVLEETSLSALGSRVHATAVEKGFWPDGANLSEKVALMHQELSELLETLRKPPAASSKVPNITAEAEEAADVLLRLVDYCAARGIDLDKAVALKHLYNTTRPYKHGKGF